ncbi:ArsR/SmtB family transcription factor [Chitinophaga filiformis]|uniref:DNA-binding transcriptional regulator, ArsR family n=1 Tax=Chitinophaga filiformis TaxID=104663 RepID=A0A1G7NKK5_CHIFI|nr:metalloregulator ArsR/SmtB family transcription factor [Chitinophaga filiformis]SDF73819.1 DNA-binding transcriptional regulator, ArsR family [Chitinophaga filiformis]
MTALQFDSFQAIADPSRREILLMLAGDKKSINSIAEQFDISRPAISKHIKVLHQAGFITFEEKGRERYCILRQEGFDELKEWINFFDNFWKERLGKLEKLLEKNPDIAKKKK